jgi:hypothetical protein
MDHYDAYVKHEPTILGSAEKQSISFSGTSVNIQTTRHYVVLRKKIHMVLPTIFTTMNMRHLGEVQPQNTRCNSTRYREVLCKDMPKTMDGFTCQDWRRFVLFLLLLLLGVNQVKFGGSQAQQTHHKDEHRTRASQHNSNKLPANNLQPAHIKYLILR